MLYFIFLRQVDWYYNNASTVAPNSPDAVKRSFENQIGLSDQEFQILVSVAGACAARVGAQDAQAKQLIDSIHSQTPGGRLNPGQKPPPVPPELVAMQNARDSLMDGCVASVQQQLPSAFPK